MDALKEFIVANPILAAALSSVWGAVVVDLMAFKNSKDPGSFFQTFSFKIAGWRYLQALAGGFAGNAILAGITGTVIGLLLW